MKRFNLILEIAEKYKDDQSKFERVCDVAENFLSLFGEQVYQTEAAKFAQLILQSKFLSDPEKIGVAYKRVAKTMNQEELKSFFENEVV